MPTDRAIAVDTFVRRIAPFLSEQQFRRKRNTFVRKGIGVTQTLSLRRRDLPEVVQLDKYLDVTAQFAEEEVNVGVQFKQFPGWPFVDPSGISEPFTDATIEYSVDFHIDWLSTIFFPLVDELIAPEKVANVTSGIYEEYLVYQYRS